MLSWFLFLMVFQTYERRYIAKVRLKHLFAFNCKCTWRSGSRDQCTDQWQCHILFGRGRSWTIFFFFQIKYNKHPFQKTTSKCRFYVVLLSDILGNNNLEEFWLLRFATLNGNTNCRLQLHFWNFKNMTFIWSKNLMETQPVAVCGS